MGDLILRSQSRSQLRQTFELALNATFPVWGVFSPLMSAYYFASSIGSAFDGGWDFAQKDLSYFCFGFLCSITCLILKRSLAHDRVLVDRQGIKLPHLVEWRFNLVTYIPWSSVRNIAALISVENVEKSQIVVHKINGVHVLIPVKALDAGFVEQFILAAQLWAPELCDPSLELLQDQTQMKTRRVDQKNYTELWEEELGRRFSPTSYVPLQTGRVLRNSSLKIVNQLSSGGLSALYLCQLDGKQLVVLKEAVAPEECAESIREKAREMFEREALLLMKVDHSGIVRVLDSFAENKRNYLLLEHINGVDLRQLVLQNGAQKESEVLEWAIQIATSMKYLHEREQPIIHRDLTPDNIVLRNDGQAIIVDFGAANEFIGTATGTFVGKHSFISPEQLRGKATTQSDIYSFGCTLFFLLTGSEPEALSTSNPKELAPSVSQELAELIESCTQLEASDRYQSVAQMLPVLRRLAAQSMVA